MATTPKNTPLDPDDASKIDSEQDAREDLSRGGTQPLGTPTREQVGSPNPTVPSAVKPESRR